MNEPADLFAKISICVMKNHLEQKVHTAWINMTQMRSSDIGHTVRYFPTYLTFEMLFEF